MSARCESTEVYDGDPGYIPQVGMVRCQLPLDHPGNHWWHEDGLNDTDLSVEPGVGYWMSWTRKIKKVIEVDR